MSRRMRFPVSVGKVCVMKAVKSHAARMRAGIWMAAMSQVFIVLVVSVSCDSDVVRLGSSWDVFGVTFDVCFRYLRECGFVGSSVDLS